MVTCTYVSEGGTNVCKAIMKKEGKRNLQQPAIDHCPMTYSLTSSVQEYNICC
jgi:hypothetical protein